MEDESPEAPEASETAERGGFFLHVNIVFASQIVLYGLAFLMRVLLARALGDDDLGTYSLFFIAVLVAGGIANLGVGLGNIYFLNKGAYSYETLLSGSLFVTGAATVVTLLTVLGYGAAFGDELFVSGWAYWVYAAALPGVVAYLLLTSFLQGASRFPALSAVGVAQGGSAVLISAGLYAAGELDVASAVAAWTASFLIADAVAFIMVGPRRINFKQVLWPDWTALRDQVRYGAQGQVANLATLFNYRLDQFLVAYFVTRAAVGHYTVAVGLGEAVWWFSSAVAIVMLPRFTEMESERAAEVTPVICRNTLAVSALGAVGMVVVSPLVIRVLFGAEFDPAFLPLVLLMPGIVAASATRVLGSYLFSQGKIIYNTYATFIALGVTLALDLALIPWLKVEGAAIASSVAYTCALAATLYWFTTASRRSIGETLLVRRQDLEEYAAGWRRLRTRLR
jgi:O-antigen/teichoic acid export membrane protein